MKTVNKEEFESTCQLFIAAVHKYFDHLGKVSKQPVEKSETGVPYVKDKDSIALKDFTGMIGISGNRKGFVYISGEQSLYKDLIKIFLLNDNPSTDQIADMAGEVSNVISGNVRESYGNDFMISVPIVFTGKPGHIKFPEDVPVFVIPISWKQHEAFVVIGLE